MISKNFNSLERIQDFVINLSNYLVNEKIRITKYIHITYLNIKFLV